MGVVGKIGGVRVAGLRRCALEFGDFAIDPFHIGAQIVIDRSRIVQQEGGPLIVCHSTVLVARLSMAKRFMRLVAAPVLHFILNREKCLSLPCEPAMLSPALVDWNVV